jgi:hypothetical protein
MFSTIQKILGSLDACNFYDYGTRMAMHCSLHPSKCSQGHVNAMLKKNLVAMLAKGAKLGIILQNLNMNKEQDVADAAYLAGKDIGDFLNILVF